MTKGEWTGLPINGGEETPVVGYVQPVAQERRLSPSAILLHETIIRALQMVVNVWKAYLKDEKEKQNLQD